MNISLIDEIKNKLLSSDSSIALSGAKDLAYIFTSDYSETPVISWADSFNLLKECDGINPGVADQFWSEVYFDCPDWELASMWLLDVLRQRANKQMSPTAPFHSFKGTDLEFYAHEIFDSDPEVLSELIDLGYVSAVSMALEHDELEPEIHKELIRKMMLSGDQEAVKSGINILWFRYRIIHSSGIDLGILRKIKVNNKLEVVVQGLVPETEKIGSVFICFEDQGMFISQAEAWKIFDKVMECYIVGDEVARSNIADSEKFSIIPKLDGSTARTRFFSYGYSATIFGSILKDKINSIRVDFPKVKSEIRIKNIKK